MIRLANDASGVAAIGLCAGRAPIVAVDAEANGLHAYRARLCTLQLAWEEPDGVEIAVIDALAAPLDALAPLLGDAGPVKVLHDLAFDARILAVAGLRLGRARDTAIAARMLGRKATGLASLLASELGLALPKDLQHHDWGRRPLRDEDLTYLAGDVAHLFALDRKLSEEAALRGVVEAIEEECAYRLETSLAPEPDDARPAWVRIKGVAALDAAARAVLRHLAEARERAAAQADVPPFKIVSNEVLLAIARARPAGGAALRAIPGATAGRARLLERDFLAAVRQGAADGDAPLEERAWLDPPRVDRAEAARRRAIESKLTTFRRERAKARGVDEQVVLPGHALRDAADALVALPPEADDDAALAAIAAVRGLGARRLREDGAALIAARRGA